MTDPHRSGCPINLTLEVIGDKWSLLIIRDIIFGNRRHFLELLRGSEERIASNILTDRLKKLVAQGIITKAADPSHKQKSIFSLTRKGIELLPILAQMGTWGRKYLPASPELSIRAQLLDEGGPTLWEEFMAELRAAHLRTGARGNASSARGDSVAVRLNAAYEKAVAREQRRKRRSPS